MRLEQSDHKWTIKTYVSVMCLQGIQLTTFSSLPTSLVLKGPCTVMLKKLNPAAFIHYFPTLQTRTIVCSGTVNQNRHLGLH